MFCKNCGNEVGKDDKFCANCGCKIENQTENEIYNVEEILNRFNNNRIEACKYISNTYRLSLSESKKLVDNQYNKMKFKKNICNQINDTIASNQLLQHQENERLKELDKQHITYCPKCHSTQITAQKKGFGLLKGAAGIAIAGPCGILAAGIGKNKIILTCMNCGYQFKPGK